MPYLANVASFGFADIPTAAILRVFKDLGCVRCQFYRNENNPPTVADALKMTRDAGLPFDSLHGVFGIKYDPSSPDESVRTATVETYRREGDLARQLNGKWIVVHPARPVTSPDDHAPHIHALRMTSLGKTMLELARIGESLGVVYLIENLPANFCLGADPAAIAAMVRRLNSPHVRMCFDTGHAHMTGDVTAALTACLDVVGYLHVHDNDALEDNHLIPGRGTLPWEALRPVLAKVPATTAAMLELFQDEKEFRAEMAQGLKGKLAHWVGTGGR